jgi:hypothetical protein
MVLWVFWEGGLVGMSGGSPKIPKIRGGLGVSKYRIASVERFSCVLACFNRWGGEKYLLAQKWLILAKSVCFLRGLGCGWGWGLKKFDIWRGWSCAGAKRGGWGLAGAA